MKGFLTHGLDEDTNNAIAEDVHNVILDLVRYGVPLRDAIREGWALTKEMVRLTSKNQNVFEDVIDMRRILYTAVNAALKNLQMKSVEWSHSTLQEAIQEVTLEAQR